MPTPELSTKNEVTVEAVAWCCICDSIYTRNIDAANPELCPSCEDKMLAQFMEEF